MFIYFAHNGVEHGQGVEEATHNLPMLIGLVFIASAGLMFAYWLLKRQPAKQDQEEEDS